MAHRHADVEAVERALQRLAKVRSWRASRRIAADILAPLSAVLPVEEDEHQDPEVALSAALPGHLHNAISRINREELRFAAAVYFSVPDRAQQTVLGRSDWKDLSLAARREIAATTLGRDFRGDEEGRLRGIVAGELVASTSSSARSTRGPHVNADRDDCAETIRQSLKTLYPGAAAIDSLADAVLPHRPPLKDTRLELTLSYDRNTSTMACRMRVKYTSKMSRFTAAIVDARVECERILSLCPGVDYATVAGTRSEHDAMVAELLRNRQVLNVMRTERRATRQRTAPFSLADRAMRLELLAEYLDEGGSLDDVSIVTADLGPFQDETGDVRIIWDRTVQLREPHRFYFWLTDRPTHITHIRIDARQLDFDGSPVARVHSFLMATTQPLSLGSDGILDAELNCWITSGQGLGVAW